MVLAAGGIQRIADIERQNCAVHHQSRGYGSQSLHRTSNTSLFSLLCFVLKFDLNRNLAQNPSQSSLWSRQSSHCLTMHNNLLLSFETLFRVESRIKVLALLGPLGSSSKIDISLFLGNGAEDDVHVLE